MPLLVVEHNATVGEAEKLLKLSSCIPNHCFIGSLAAQHFEHFYRVTTLLLLLPGVSLEYQLFHSEGEKLAVQLQSAFIA